MRKMTEFKPAFNMKGVKEKLNTLGKPYEDYEVIDTLFGQNETRYRRGKKTEFENSLSEKGIKWFAYIKFFVDNDEETKNEEKIWAIVAGKTGSNLVITKSDVRFCEYPSKGLAKEWIYNNKKKWYHPKIIVVRAQSEQDALNQEKILLKEFHLLGS
ncbi:MAG: hypothetical protein J5574_00585 [Lachnospiraceae bacterium]|nr:hypothetical protein [Lachnospiraceae bacterium]